MADMADAPGPLISIVIPAYNSAHLLGATLRTVIAQTERDWEAIVVDDSSIDDPAAVVAELDDPRIHVLRQARNGGASAARNAGIVAARGRFIAFLDADDAWMPTKLERQLGAVLAQPDPDRVFCVTRMIVSLGAGREIVRPIRGKRPDERMDEFIFVAAGFCQTSSFFVSTALMRAIDGFRKLPIGEDHMVAIDLCNAGAQYLLIEEPLATYTNDIRRGRLSRETGLADGMMFMNAVRGVLSDRALLGYESRYLGVLQLRRDPLRGAALLARAIGAGALSPRFAATLLARAVVPGNLYHRIRAALLSRKAG